MAERRYPPFKVGQYDELAAALSEGFCPSCQQPVSLRRPIVPMVSWSACKRCRCTWEHDRWTVIPVVTWHGLLLPDDPETTAIFHFSNGHLVVRDSGGWSASRGVMHATTVTAAAPAG